MYRLLMSHQSNRSVSQINAIKADWNAEQGASQPGLPAMIPNAARSALARHRLNRYRHIHVTAGRTDAFRHLDHEGPQLLGILDPVPGAIAADDNAVRRADAGFFLDHQKINPKLGTVPRPDLPGGFPFL